MLQAVRDGQVDRVVIWRLDRLGRTASGLCALFEELRKANVNLISLKDAVDLETASGRLLAQVLASVAEFEAELRKERQRLGVENVRQRQREAKKMHKEGVPLATIAVRLGVKQDTAKRMIEKRGHYWGGSKKGSGVKRSASHERIRELVGKGLGQVEIARICGVSHATVTRRIKEMGGMMGVRRSVRAAIIKAEDLES